MHADSSASRIGSNLVGDDLHAGSCRRCVIGIICIHCRGTIVIRIGRRCISIISNWRRCIIVIRIGGRCIGWSRGTDGRRAPALDQRVGYIRGRAWRIGYSIG